jgi:hypothetical protein
VNNSIQRLSQLTLALALTCSASTTHAGFVIFEAATSITPTVDAFRAALGTLNPNDGNHHPSGRREINWDAVPDSASDPNPFPGTFFNSTTIAGRSRGALFSTPGSGFLVSADSNNPSATTPGFGFPAEFIPFSPERLFAPIGSNITDVTFFVPGPTTPATVTGFGSVFSDVEFADTTKIEFFNLTGNNIFSRSVLTAGNAALSFLGAVADAGEKIARVRITTGINPLLANGDFGPGATEGVVMDDFLYAEPQAIPEPNSAAFLLSATSLAIGSGTTPKPITIASEALASITSDVLIPPVPW